MRTSLEQASFFEPVAHARASHPRTSHGAAAKVQGISELKQRILACYIAGPCHDEELIRRYRDLFPERKDSDQAIRSRRSELANPRFPEPRRLEKVLDTYGETQHGRKSQVWRLAQ